ncbi:protein FAR1-RELATED SEQUENCE 5-like [Silene latifolia]|uniref:protein FAR1-RELATED SEQUENCE 5-like n=1 Tax=Silene latifolia TaxID=37657 RepID=UPI003D772D7A
MTEEVIEKSIVASNVDALMNNDIPPMIPLTNAPVGSGNTIFGFPSCPEDLKPINGMMFSNLEDGIDFYNKYAKVCGFIPRLDSTKLVNRIVTHKRCVCNKEGKSRNKGTKRKRTVTRTGCEAKVSFKRIDTGEYQIYDFVEVHTHAMVTPATMVHMKPSRNLNLFHKKMIMDNSRVNHGPVDSFRMFKEYVKGDVKKYIKEYDAEMLLETFMQKKAMSPSFYFDFEVDEKRLSKVFWADPISIKNYALFGEAVSFDATYNFYEYKMVFCPFTGVDNHKRCVTFAGGLLRKEDGESFTWLFENFVKAMGDCYPTTIITDQCKGINQVVKDVFGDKTQHRLCMWHIMKKLPDKVGPTICQNTNFLKEINSIVWDGEIDTQEFELRWKSILSSYELSDHEWLKSMFDIRSSWIPAYFRDIYLGGIMRTTSRSESENNFFGNFTNPHLTLVEFWMRFQSAMDAQRWKYAKVTADDKNSSPKLSTPLLLEKKNL